MIQNIYYKEYHMFNVSRNAPLLFQLFARTYADVQIHL